MLIIFSIFSVVWLCLFIYSFYVARDDFLGTAFICFQFVFIGFGLLIWPLVSDSASIIFTSYHIEYLTSESVIRANCILLTGVLVTYSTYQVLKNIILRGLVEAPVGLSVFPSSKIFLTTFCFGLVAIYFIASRADLLVMAVTTSGADSLVALAEARQKATSSYILTLIVYNIYPAATYACVVGYIVNKTKFWRNTMVISVALALLALFLVFQKRPMIIYLIGIFFIFKFNQQSKNIKIQGFDFYRLIVDLRYIILMLFLLLIAFYYFYTNYRFENDFITSIMLNAEAAFTRIFGRLSIPALMYSQYYPKVDDFYSFSNVGLFSKVGGYVLYKDVVEVANHFSLTKGQGSLAASVFFDFYGGFGYLGVVLGGIVVGLFLLVGHLLIKIRQAPIWRTFLASVLIINIFYLSQSSLFRSIAGYGGATYILFWLYFKGGFSFKWNVNPKGNMPNE
jgi:hypothetical protein